MELALERRSRMQVDPWGARRAASLYAILLFGFAGALALGCLAVFAVKPFGLVIPFEGFGIIGLVGFVGANALRGIWFLSRRRKKAEEAIALQADLHELHQKEFEARYEAARLNGDLDRWNKDK